MTYPPIVEGKRISNADMKLKCRYSLKIKLKKNGNESIIVILKNPSKADEDKSDYTVNRVISYIYNCKTDSNSILNNISSIIILNLFPIYEPKSNKLPKSITESTVRELNLNEIKKYTSQHKKVIVAWGNHPANLKREFETLSSETLRILTENENTIYHIGLLSKSNNPKHGQVWKNIDIINNYCLSK